jgi:hypothetical protein
MNAIEPFRLNRDGRISKAASSVGRMPPWALGAAALAGIVALAALGQIHRHDPGSHWYLDSEDTLPAGYSGALLLAAAVLSVMVASLLPSGRFRAFWAGIAALFAFMALDEVWTIHERLEGWTGADWQVFYAPIAVAAGLLLVANIRELAAFHGAAALFVAGGLAWLAAQVLEDLQWTGDVLVHEWMIVPEEVLEMLGALLFGLASLVVLRQQLSRETPNRV